MVLELNVYTGIINYKGIEFTFSFDGEELRMIPPKDKKREVDMWFKTEMSPGVCSVNQSVYIESDFLEGTCNESGNGFIFIVSKNRPLGRYNSVLVVSVDAYIKKTLRCATFDKIKFSSKELNRIYMTNKAIEKSGWTEDGELALHVKSFKDTATLPQEFTVDGKSVNVQFGIEAVNDGRKKQAPILLQTIMSFEFEATDDYNFIYKLWLTARNFIQFLCYRMNVDFSNVKLASTFKAGTHLTSAEFHVLNVEDIAGEIKPVEKDWLIKYDYIAGKEGNILTDIAKENLYLRHVPESYRSGRIINAARFVMITAAFEWEVRRLFPEGIPKSNSAINIENEASKAIDTLISESTGKLRKKYEFLKSLIPADTLQRKIIKASEKIDPIVGQFGRKLYELNELTLKYSEMGERISKQRNNFAHGNLDQEFIGVSLCDLIYLEYIIYAMQLKCYDIDERNIQKAINDLFHLNFLIQ